MQCLSIICEYLLSMRHICLIVKAYINMHPCTSACSNLFTMEIFFWFLRCGYQKVFVERLNKITEYHFLTAYFKLVLILISENLFL